MYKTELIYIQAKDIGKNLIGKEERHKHLTWTRNEDKIAPEIKGEDRGIKDDQDRLEGGTLFRRSFYSLLSLTDYPSKYQGVVASVTPHTAEVALLCDRAVRVACEIEQSGGVRTRGILCGGTEDLLSLRHLTNAQTVAPRSRVVTSGLGGVFPKGLAVGTLHDIHNGEDGLPYRGDVLPSVDFSTLEDVFIRREK